MVAAERFVAIMESYDFGLDLIQRHNLVPVLTQNAAFAGSPSAPTPWRLHLELDSRFDSEYDYRTGNLTLYFTDPERAMAQRILAYYLERLRDRLRSEAVRASSSAAASLAEEVGKTPDALLQNQLYELMARQIQREKLAQVQADFAFKVVEPPVVPDHYYAPVARSRAALSGFIVLAVFCGWAVVREWLRGANAALVALAAGVDAPMAIVPALAEVVRNNDTYDSARRQRHWQLRHGRQRPRSGQLMCGIGGFVSAGRRPVLERAIHAMTAAQRHRGPDDGGIALVPAGSGAFAALGSRRLAIIDQSPAGRQPMTNATESAWVVFNGEIYNFRALRTELTGAGYAFQSRTDTEVVLHGYDAWGVEGLLRRLRGMFAFAIWDVRRRRMVFARDRLGEKPLYYALTRGRLLFASELRALIASGMAECSLSPAGTYAYLALGSLPAPLTIADPVRALEPGQYGVFAGGSSGS